MTCGSGLVSILLNHDSEVHIWVYGAGDLVGSGLGKGDRLGVARVDLEAWISQFLWRVRVRDALAVVTGADDMQAAGVRRVNELEWRIHRDGDAMLSKVVDREIHMVNRATRGIATAAWRLAACCHRDGAEKQEGKQERCYLLHT